MRCCVCVSFELNKEKITQGRSGAKRCTVAFRNEGRLDELVITTTMPTVQGQMHLVETRRLLDKGHTHSQVSSVATKQELRDSVAESSPPIESAVGAGVGGLGFVSTSAEYGL